MEIARGTDLPDLLTSLGYTVTRVGHYHSTKEMDSLRIKNRRTWYRYSEQTGGDAITFLQHFCGRSFPGMPPRSGAGRLSRRRNRRNRLHCRRGTPMPAGCAPT